MFALFSRTRALTHRAAVDPSVPCETVSIVLPSNTQSCVQHQADEQRTPSGTFLPKQRRASWSYQLLLLDLASLWGIAGLILILPILFHLNCPEISKDQDPAIFRGDDIV